MTYVQYPITNMYTFTKYKTYTTLGNARARFPSKQSKIKNKLDRKSDGHCVHTLSILSLLILYLSSLYFLIVNPLPFLSLFSHC